MKTKGLIVLGLPHIGTKQGRVVIEWLIYLMEAQTNKKTATWEEGNTIQRIIQRMIDSCFGHPTFLFGQLVTKVKGLKCPSSVHYKNKQ